MRARTMRHRDHLCRWCCAQRSLLQQAGPGCGAYRHRRCAQVRKRNDRVSV